MLLLHPGRLFAASPPLTVFRVVFAVAGGVATLLVNYWILYGAIRVVASREKRGVTTNLGFVTFLDVTVSILVAVFIYCVFAKKLHLWP